MMLNKNNFINSPYINGRMVKEDDGTIIQLPSQVIIDYNTCSLHTIKPEETLQSIAAYAYGDSGLWFVIAKANKILNTLKEVKDGDLILIPHSYGI